MEVIYSTTLSWPALHISQNKLLDNIYFKYSTTKFQLYKLYHFQNCTNYLYIFCSVFLIYVLLTAILLILTWFLK